MQRIGRFISQPASPAGGGGAGGSDVQARAHHAVRTSRSEDHLQVHLLYLHTHITNHDEIYNDG